MKKFLQTTLFTFVLVTFSNAFANKPESPTYNEDNTTVQVTAQHPEFTIKLKSNPTTGYMWYLREYSTKMITPIKHNFEVPHTKIIGAPGYELWTFRVNSQAFVVPQMLTVRFIYTRPWKNSDAGTQVIFRVMTQKQ